MSWLEMGANMVQISAGRVSRSSTLGCFFLLVLIFVGRESTRLGPTMSRGRYNCAIGGSHFLAAVALILVESILIHNEWVRNHVPQDRLLTMDLKEGWEPLAKFLNKAVPNEPFPHANDGEAMQKFAKGVFRTAMLIWLGILGGAGLLAWVGMAVWRRSLLSSV